MDNAAFAGVVMNRSVIRICEFFSRAVSRRRNRRPAFSSADDFDAQMIDGNKTALLLLDKKKRRTYLPVDAPNSFILF